MFLIALDEEENEIRRFGCDLNDHERFLLAPMANRLEMSEKTQAFVSLEMNKKYKQSISAEATTNDATYKKIKSGQNVFLNGTIILVIDGVNYNVSIIGPFNPILSLYI